MAVIPHACVPAMVVGVAFVASPSNPLAQRPTQSDLQKLAAVAGNYIGTSTDSGVTWVERAKDINPTWISIASSSDGTVRQVWMKQCKHGCHRRAERW